ncbi:CDP-diacylglycerol--glycerol-3-phosphate 3-phosphatidyltransferase [Paenibacillus macerans]|uniref:CDP-diacylglycerol--glycerol-3-phosphate 3-phosphatidyltransferase n=1 Tax=Paenibacillus macerans TaxID=44252 RepID=A0A090ZFQ5_PAEMA|nr:CDP-diacylglycerol--glycerol-3-phosphate 3-phosphatidyltransferase [Paenibacillus macerans]KFN09050.1 CDP-diacylglycerol--glycerol-3-phosphate 3-phosphatidyltransferase [Paenibacillus macerans]MCY7560905.1 CDP-diacylglycerol--glycerol-3-phosphate 3-phosphatidyltransferase [Paenibacillus macerans]MDU7477722.1 CDP-diacylglycerol--glycerol-3-phosphate 3-phosphatidyltransferase [Paenibacillus macerans]MEC0135974.1 CDP-diacylglycerol--glycerol-3-phosphate 3-phosphatidyltransferase [Paenibacillus 
MNLPNRITLTRIFMIPVMLLFLLLDAGWLSYELVAGTYALPVHQLIAAVLFIVAASTDGIDGYIARKYNLVTNLGKLLDPLADKLLVGTVLIGLVSLGKCNAWIAVIIIAREFAVTGLREVALLEGSVIAASKWGKAKTIIQIIAITVLLLNNFPFAWLNIPFDDIAIWLAAIITIYSGIDYFVKNKSVLSFSKM